MMKATMIGTVNLKQEIEKREENERKVKEYKEKHPNEFIIETCEDLDIALKASRKTPLGFDTPYRIVCPRCRSIKIRMLYDILEVFNKGGCGCVQSH